jgi:uncharacterized cupredoxin-like copper-binding protein
MPGHMMVKRSVAREQGYRARFWCPLAKGKRLAILFLGLSLGACEWTGESTLTVTAEEFRFTPQHVTAPAHVPMTLVIRNQGRERHVFQSPELFLKGTFGNRPGHPDGRQQADTLVLDPGQSVEVMVELPPGLYPFRCWIKGHSGMEGMIMVHPPKEGPLK